MTNTDVAVTYTGREDPYKDRIYRTGLTFTPGQTRALPAPLAARFLQHSDVFTAAKADAAAKAEKGEKKDDTAVALEAAKMQEDTQREQEDARFALMNQIDSMDKKAVADWAFTHYNQKIPGNLGDARAREMAKGFIDQYGMP